MNRLRKALFDSSVAILVTVGVIVAASSLWFQYAVYGDRALPRATTDVLVPRGSAFGDIARILADHHVISHPIAFRILARLRHDDESIEAGEYRFAAHRNSDEVLRELVVGSPDVAVWVTIPEGFTTREIAQTLATHHLGDERAYEHYFLTNHLAFGGWRTANLEGYLFPSTYLIPDDSTPASVTKTLTEQFRQELPADAAVRARALGRTIPEVVTIASLIEREAQADDERALMAGVYYNRLRLGMPLEVDAAIEYVFPEHHEIITKRDLAINSPYNTYLHLGLPPTPIANPGKASLDAAFNPEPSDYLYYVYKGDGHHAFAKTLAEHNANVAHYLK